MRRLPAVFAMLVLQRLSDVQVTPAPVAAPVSFSSASGVLRLVPVALFQWLFATTPAVSVAAIAVPVPTKSMLMALSNGGVISTRSVSGAEWLSTPLVPFTNSVAVPNGVLADVVTVIVALPAPSTAAGSNDAVTPAGRLLALSVTIPAKPFSAPMFTVYATLPPGGVSLTGTLAPIEKSGAGGGSRP